MSSYYNLAKLGRVALPSGTEYALIDVDGRAIITENYSSAASYTAGNYVIGVGLTGTDATYNDCLLRAKSDITAGAFDSSKWEIVTVASELHRLEQAIAGGVHYRGKTSTALYDGSTASSITISGSPYTPEAGDMVIVDRSAVAVTYATATAYSKNTYIKKTGETGYWITNAAITSTENTSWSAVEAKMDLLKTDPEFIYDGSIWNVLGAADGLGDLAFKDTASGTYRRPTGSGSVTVDTVTAPTKKKLSTTTITGTNGTVNATYVTGGTEKDIAKVGTAVRYGTADVGTAVVYGTANRAASATVYGTANVDAAVAVGTSLTGTKTFNTDAIKSATLTGTKTFNTDAIKSASLTGTKTFATSGITTSVSGDCLTFSTAGTGTVGISTTAASTGTVGIETTAASTATVGLGTTNITPAVAAPNTQTIYGAVSAPSSQTLTPAVAAPNTQTLTPAASNGTLTGSYTLSQQTPAKVASAATTVATGGLETGDQLVSDINTGTDTRTVTVGYENATVTVR